MRFIPTRVHGYVDYLGGIALLSAPYIFGFAEQGGAAVWMPWLIGAAVLAQSIFTRYELGLIKVWPMKMHLLVDYVGSLALAASPFIFGFNDGPINSWLPHIVVGLGVFVLSLMTEEEPSGNLA